jgi:HNH endonuclease
MLTFTAKDRRRFERFLFWEPTTGCALFAGYTTKKGHGMFRIAGRSIHAHRIAWLLAGRDIPPGHQIMHNCPFGDEPSCCNVDHLLTGTPLDHARDKARKWQGREGNKGLPYGVVPLPSGLFSAQVGATTVGTRYLGSFPTKEEAAARALTAKKAVYGMH